tara:strand:+ start:106 stop:333 length:228 start_codon:yes stop_codon:yes gene_type:complete
MKIIKILFFLLIVTGCSFNNNSKFWTDGVKKRKIEQKKISEVMKKSDNLMSLSFEEYEIFIEEYVKKSNYPDINK